MVMTAEWPNFGAPWERYTWRPYDSGLNTWDCLRRVNGQIGWRIGFQSGEYWIQGATASQDGWRELSMGPPPPITIPSSESDFNPPGRWPGSWQQSGRFAQYNIPLSGISTWQGFGWTLPTNNFVPNSGYLPGPSGPNLINPRQWLTPTTTSPVVLAFWGGGWDNSGNTGFLWNGGLGTTASRLLLLPGGILRAEVYTGSLWQSSWWPDGTLDGTVPMNWVGSWQPTTAHQGVRTPVQIRANGTEHSVVIDL